MRLTPALVGSTLYDHRSRLRLSQPEAARRAGVSTRLWAETERGERPNVSAATLMRMLEVLGVALQPTSLPAPGESIAAAPISHTMIATLRQDLWRAAEYGVDLSLIRSGLDLTPLQRIRENDEALAFFDSVTVEPGWRPESSQSRPGRSRRHVP